MLKQNTAIRHGRNKSEIVRQQSRYRKGLIRELAHSNLELV
jgi:hypothetical protein